MEKSAGKRAKFGRIDTQVWHEFFSVRHPLKMVACIAAETGIPARTIHNWFAGTSQPTMRAFCRLVAAYGPEFLAICMPSLVWLSDAARASRKHRLDAEIARIENELARLARRD